MLIKVNLEPFPKDYINFILSNGESVARQCLKLPLIEGEIFTFLPPDFHLPATFNFENSLNLVFHIYVLHEFEQIINQMIKDFLDTSASRLAIFETRWNINSPIEKRSNNQRFTINDIAYLFIIGSDINPSINTYRMLANDYATVIALADFPVKNEIIPLLSGSKIPELGQNDLELIVQSIQYLILGAFDGDGYIIWSRSPK